MTIGHKETHRRHINEAYLKGSLPRSFESLDGSTFDRRPKCGAVGPTARLKYFKHCGKGLSHDGSEK
jgi:uncharacterized C2H2 Zn-finger protein